MNEECAKCEARAPLNGFFTEGLSVCDCRCGRPENGKHPLSPCRQICADVEVEDLVCYEDDDAILEGHRCVTYCHWLQRMHEAVCDRVGHSFYPPERRGSDYAMICMNCGCAYLARPMTEDEAKAWRVLE